MPGKPADPSEADIAAMVGYLKLQTRQNEPPEPAQIRLTPKQGEELIRKGAKLYAKHCAGCHQRRGEGVPRIYPPLVNNQAILIRYPINSIRIVVNDGFPPST